MFLNFSYKKNFLSILTNFLHVFKLKNGKYKTNFINTNKIISFFFSYFFNNINILSYFKDKNIFKNFYFFYEFKTLLLSKSVYLNFNYLLYVYLNSFKSLFLLKSFLIEKKIRKKKKLKYNYKLNFISKVNRFFLSFFYLKVYFFLFSNFKFKDKILILFFDTLLNYKKSKVFIYKINIYKKFFI